MNPGNVETNDLQPPLGPIGPRPDYIPNDPSIPNYSNYITDFNPSMYDYGYDLSPCQGGGQEVDYPCDYSCNYCNDDTVGFI